MKIHPFQPTPPSPISIVIHNNNYFDQDTYNDRFTWDVRYQFFWWKYKCLIVFLSVVLLASIIILSLVFFNSSSETSSSSSNPCEKYRADDLANSISMACFQNIWSKAGCVEKGKGTVPDEYNGWWLRSPSGGKTVPCIEPNVNERCGAGNYGTIVNNLWICDLNYRGY